MRPKVYMSQSTSIQLAILYTSIQNSHSETVEPHIGFYDFAIKCFLFSLPLILHQKKPKPNKQKCMIQLELEQPQTLSVV